MATVLAVLANPRENSYTAQLLQIFLNAYQKRHPQDTITLLDVYKEELPVIDEVVLRAWEKEQELLTEQERARLADVDVFTQQFIKADKVVIAAPMWNLQFPPLLMGYIANIAVAGKTFEYTEKGWRGLVTDKPLLLMHVRGGVFSQGPAQAYDHAVPYLRSLCQLLGIQDFRTLLCEGIEAFPEQKEAIFQQAAGEAVKMAEIF